MTCADEGLFFDFKLSWGSAIGRHSIFGRLFGDGGRFGDFCKIECTLCTSLLTSCLLEVCVTSEAVLDDVLGDDNDVPQEVIDEEQIDDVIRVDFTVVSPIMATPFVSL